MEDLSASIITQTVDFTMRALGGGGDDGHEGLGVHITYDQLFFAMVYITMIYVIGFLFERVLFCPALVGQIAAGIIFGPELVDIVPYPQAFVLLGEIGLVLLVIEAGVDIDVTTLKLIGKRGVIIATLGSIFPIAIGLGVAYALGAPTKAAIAAGASFGPTSLGIAMNILRTGKIINTPTGQLIVAAAIIDDMIALIILSQLSGLVGEITVSGVVIPIVSALVFLVLGGYIALFILPGLLDRFIFREGMEEKTHGRVALAIMFALVIGLMQATKVTKASYLMGAFIAGLVFCTDHHLHVEFVSQFKRILQWLMRIFFASTIGFQVPIKQFASGKIIGQGFLFTLAHVGKLVVGFMVPNFTQEKNFTGNHLRDCLIVGCSMAAEGEFAFVIAAFSVQEGLIEKDLYSSIVFAILLSTIIAPFSLRFTITYFNKRAMAAVLRAEEEMTHQRSTGGVDAVLTSGILEGTTVFYCIHTTSHAAWGTLPSLMNSLFELELEVIDHRSWHTKFESTVINEVYAKGVLKKDVSVESEIEVIENKVKDAINQNDAVVLATRWSPGVVDEIKDSEHGGAALTQNVAERVAKEALKNLDQSEHQDQKKDEIRSQFEHSIGTISETGAPTTRRNRKRVKIVSTPIGGGDMFSGGTEVFQPHSALPRRRRVKTMSTPISGDMWGDTATVVLAPGEIVINIIGPNDEKYAAKMKEETYKSLIESGTPQLLSIAEPDTQFMGQYLDGFVRRSARTKSISEV